MEKVKSNFTAHLAYLNKGTLNDDLTDELAEVVKAVRETGKQGTLTLTLKVGLLERTDEDMVQITPQVTSKVPQLDRPKQVMWSTADGDLLSTKPGKANKGKVTKVS